MEIFKKRHFKEESKKGRKGSETIEKKLLMPTDEDVKEVASLLKIENRDDDLFSRKSRAETRITEETNATMGFLNDRN